MLPVIGQTKAAVFLVFEYQCYKDGALKFEFEKGSCV